MKNIYIIFLPVLIAFSVFLSQSTYACTGSTLAGNITPSDNWQTVGGVQAGDRYTFSINTDEVIIFSFCQGGGSYTNDPRIDIHDEFGTLVHDKNS